MEAASPSSPRSSHARSRSRSFSLTRNKSKSKLDMDAMVSVCLAALQCMLSVPLKCSCQAGCLMIHFINLADACHSAKAWIQQLFIPNNPQRAAFQSKCTPITLADKCKGSFFDASQPTLAQLCTPPELATGGCSTLTIAASSSSSS